MATPVPVLTQGFSPLGRPNPFARRPDPLLALLGSVAGAAVGQTLLPAVAQQQRLIQHGANLGPATPPEPPTALLRLRERGGTLADAGSALATVSETLAEASIPTEDDLLAARQRTAGLVRTYNDALKQITSSPLVLKEELADGLEATATALESSLNTVGITIDPDGALTLSASTLADELSTTSTTVATAAATLRELGSRLGALGTQLRAAPNEALLYQPTPDPRVERPGRQPQRTPSIAIGGAGLVYAYLFAKQQVRMLSDLGSLGASGALFNAVV